MESQLFDANSKVGLFWTSKSSDPADPWPNKQLQSTLDELSATRSEKDKLHSEKSELVQSTQVLNAKYDGTSARVRTSRLVILHSS